MLRSAIRNIQISQYRKGSYCDKPGENTLAAFQNRCDTLDCETL